MERGEDSLDSEINQVDKHRSTEREAAVSNPGWLVRTESGLKENVLDINK